MKKINGTIISLSGCNVTKHLSVGIESSDEISLTELIGKKVEIILVEEKPVEVTFPEKAEEGLISKTGCGKSLGVNGFCGSEEYPFCGNCLCKKCQAKYYRATERASTYGNEDTLNVEEGK